VCVHDRTEHSNFGNFVHDVDTERRGNAWNGNSRDIFNGNLGGFRLNFGGWRRLMGLTIDAKAATPAVPAKKLPTIPRMNVVHDIKAAGSVLAKKVPAMPPKMTVSHDAKAAMPGKQLPSAPQMGSSLRNMVRKSIGMPRSLLSAEATNTNVDVIVVNPQPHHHHHYVQCGLLRCWDRKLLSAVGL
jgi:hypothetical protein